MRDERRDERGEGGGGHLDVLSGNDPLPEVHPFKLILVFVVHLCSITGGGGGDGGLRSVGLQRKQPMSSWAALHHQSQRTSLTFSAFIRFAEAISSTCLLQFLMKESLYGGTGERGEKGGQGG